MKKEPWDKLLELANITKSGRHDISEMGFGVKFTDGFLDGSIGKVISVYARKPWSSYHNQSLRVASIGFMLDKRRDITAPYYISSVIQHKGSSATLMTGFNVDPVVSVSEPIPKDCFGAEYEVGKIVAYKRDNKQIFGTVEGISEEGRVKLRRIYNQTRQKNDFISYRLAHEHLIIDDKLLNKLMILRLKTD